MLEVISEIFIRNHYKGGRGKVLSSRISTLPTAPYPTWKSSKSTFKNPLTGPCFPNQGNMVLLCIRLTDGGEHGTKEDTGRC